MSLGQAGISRLAVLMYIMAAVLVVYGVIKTVPPYMDFYAMDDEVAQQLHLAAINSDDVIMNDLTHKAEELGLPVAREDISLVHTPEGGVEIHMKWVTEVDYGYGFKREFPFEINASTGRSGS